MPVNYIRIFKAITFILCLLFVVERSMRCSARFYKKPQAVEIKISDGSDEILPHFTFCAEEAYNETFLEECGLEL